MVRSPCCDKVGTKKGPWTPREDVILVSYIQDHGPANWRSVPVNTGLMRCSKSCRLRWTNYLRPGIKRCNFTLHEEGIITHLQAMLGNKWAAIASYLPQRTDNDIKNYWNTHLKKKLQKYQTSKIDHNSNLYVSRLDSKIMPKLNIMQDSTIQNQLTVNSQNATYASSTENISKLLESWMRPSTKPNYEDSIEIQNDFDSVMEMDKYNLSTDHDAEPVLSYLEKWLLDESTNPFDGFMQIND